MKHLYLLFLILIIFSCAKQSNNLSYKNPVIVKGDSTFYDSLQKRWYFRSYDTDSVCGISLKKAYKEIIKSKSGEQVIVAIIDTDVNTEHEDLKDFIWVNENEIVGNSKDDDGNGYIDDINGWNFLRKSNGERIIYANNSNVNYVKKYSKLLENDTISYPEEYKLYKKALAGIEENKNLYDAYMNQAMNYEKEYLSSKKIVDSIFKEHNPSFDELDSIYYKYETTKPKVANSAAFIFDHKLYDYSDYADLRKQDAKAVRDICNNMSWNIEDNSNGKLGHPKINGDLKKMTHGTLVSGVLASNQTNGKGAEGVTNNVKLMILSLVVRQGAEIDKYVAEAIRYAVDNGAKVINYSSSKSYSADEEIVKEALKYAEEKNVMFITSAGNDGKDLDKSPMYPNAKFNGTDLDNFITVGASHAYLGDELRLEWSNYGENYVDLFAPGIQINTTTSKGGYKLENGTSLATPLVSGVAAMLYSYFPNLTAKQIKDIILSTTDKYDIEVDLGNGNRRNFKDLSSSGGILNAYEALKKAESITTSSNEK